MDSKFYNDLVNEGVLLKLMISNGLEGKLSEYGFENINIETNQENQNDGIDLTAQSDGQLKNIDLKARFTIPIYSNRIDKTFALEIKNCNSGKIGWFIDESKRTDYYLLVYPILEKEIGDNNRDYKIEKNGDIGDNNKITGVMAQLISVNDLRARMKNMINLEKMVSFLNSSKTLPLKGKAIRYNSELAPIDDAYNLDLYFMYSPYLKERPLNLIVKQKIYSQIQDCEFHIGFNEIT